MTKFFAWIAAQLKRCESPARLDKTRRQFLPAALEVEETPAHPAGRAILWSIVTLFVIAIVWSWLGKVDIVAVAEGKVIPGERVKRIQPLQMGEVVAIHVREGDQVEAGDPLVTLDSTVTAAELARIERERALLRLQLARQQAFTRALATKDLDETGPVSIPEEDYDPLWRASTVAFENQLLNRQLEEFRATALSLQSQAQAKRGERDMVKAQLAKLRRTLPLVEERTAALAQLYEKNMASRVRYLELKQQHIEQEEDLRSQQARLRQLQGEIDGIVHQQTSLHARSRKDSLAEQEQLIRQIASLGQEQVKARQRHEQQHLAAPLAGTVQQLQIHTIGAVVQPAQVLMQIVPQDSPVEVQAWILNKDIGFVAEGQGAEVKVDTFNFTRYGVLEGVVGHISDDAVSDEQQGLRYMASVQLAKDWIQVDQRKVKLAPGMKVAVEVKTGQRRLIEYFLSPLLRFKSESVRER